MRFVRVLAIGILATFFVSSGGGCGRKKPRAVGPPAGTFVQESDGVVLIVVIDVSGSYWPKLVGNEPVAFNLVLKAISEMYAERLADPRDRIVISTISGSPEPLVWVGRVRDFRHSFANEHAFRNMLVTKAQCPGSRVHSSIAMTVDSVLNSRTFEHGKSVPFLLVMSDMEDTAGDGVSAVEASLRRLKQANGSVGLYWVGQQPFPYWNWFLSQEFGRNRSIVTNDREVNPKLPTFK